MIHIDQRTVGRSGLVVPALGVGVWSWGEIGWWNYGQSHTHDDVIQAYRTCLEAGFTFFDTAEVYGNGESERLLGECRRLDRRPITIASKFAPPLTRLSRAGRARSSARSLLDALDHSLERLSVECIDLYQIHTASPVLKVDDLMDVLAEAVQAGKVHAVGVSHSNASSQRQAPAPLARHGVPRASHQVRVTLVHPHPQ